MAIYKFKLYSLVFNDFVYNSPITKEVINNFANNGVSLNFVLSGIEQNTWIYETG